MDPFGYVIVGVPLFFIVLAVAGTMIAKRLDQRLLAKKF